MLSGRNCLSAAINGMKASQFPQSGSTTDNRYWPARTGCGCCSPATLSPAQVWPAGKPGFQQTCWSRLPKSMSLTPPPSASLPFTNINSAATTTSGLCHLSTSAPATLRRKTNSLMLTPYLGRISAGENLTMEEMAAVMTEVMSGRCQEPEIALLLTALKAKGETAEEIAGAAQVMRKHMTPIRSSRQGIVDTCGTGGVGSNIFNVSTAAALVTAAAGVPVAKHGNRSATSK